MGLIYDCCILIIKHRLKYVSIGHLEQQIRRRTLLRSMHGDLHFVKNQWYIVTIRPFNTAGEDAITEQAELTKLRAGMKHQECAKDTQPKRCGLGQANYNQFKIWEYTAKCSQQLHRISTGLVLLASGDRNTD